MTAFRALLAWLEAWVNRNTAAYIDSPRSKP